MDLFSYNGNPRLKKPGARIEFTKEQVEEYIKCAKEPQYFIEKYVRVIHVDKGPINMEMRDYTRKTIDVVHSNRFTITMMARQSGKTVTISSYILHYVLFNEAKNCIIVANKASTAKMIMQRIQYAYENLPLWLQQGVLEWNKTSIVLENESAITCYATSSSGPRGTSCVDGSTLITVKNKSTGEIMTLPISSFVKGILNKPTSSQNGFVNAIQTADFIIIPIQE